MNTYSTYRVIDHTKSCQFHFLTAQDQAGRDLSFGSIVKVKDLAVWFSDPLYRDGREIETIDYPDLVEIYVSRGYLEKFE